MSSEREDSGLALLNGAKWLGVFFVDFNDLHLLFSGHYSAGGSSPSPSRPMPPVPILPPNLRIIAVPPSPGILPSNWALAGLPPLAFLPPLLGGFPPGGLEPPGLLFGMWCPPIGSPELAIGLGLTLATSASALP